MFPRVAGLANLLIIFASRETFTDFSGGNGQGVGLFPKHITTSVLSSPEPGQIVHLNLLLSDALFLFLFDFCLWLTLYFKDAPKHIYMV